MKSKTLTFFPGDDINITIKAKFQHFTILKIDVIELEDPSTNDYKIEL